MHFTSGYKSCTELLNAGFTEDGFYQIWSNQAEVIDVYCDQSNWGGGNRNGTAKKIKLTIIVIIIIIIIIIIK